MEIGLREWLIIGGAVIVLLIVIDGLRRMRGARNQLRMDIQKLPADMVEQVVDEINPELPNGGARRLCDDSEGSDTPASATAAASATADTASVSLSPQTAPVQEPSADSAEVLPVVEAGVTERCEPTFELTDLQLEDGNVADPTVAKPAVEQVASVIDETPECGILADAVVPEPVLEKVAASVVEEEIMTSAALFEAIEQSRQKRSAAIESEAQQTPAVEATGAAPLAEILADEQPQLKPDPLLRPLPGTGIDPIAAVQNTESVKPIYLHDDEPSVDPLMRGIEDDDVEILEPGFSADVADIAESETEQAAEPTPALTIVESQPEPAVDTPRFINEIADNPPVPSQEEGGLGFTVGQAHDADLELELPAEFAPQKRPETSIISFAAVREAAGRAETVVAFPEKKDKPESESPEATEVSSADVTDTAEPVNTASQAEPASSVHSDVTVQGGSLRQQPDPANVLVMTVVANGSGGFDGKLLLQLVLACGMRFGEMNIFHRFEDGIDSGAVQFSMANATGTGVFDINAMEQLNTRAVSFFMSMEEPREVMNALECMLATAETVASHMKGELVDDNRLLMRPQTQEHYRQRVRDFEMRNLRRRSG